MVEGAEDGNAVDGFEDATVTDGSGRGDDGLGVQNPEGSNSKAKQGQSKQHAFEFALMTTVTLGWIERLGSG